MVAVVTKKQVKTELLRFLRNNDFLTITEREVTTTSDTGTFTSALTHLINVSNIKNIRSITVGGTAQEYGTDFTYDTYYNDSGTRKCKITFTSAKTGAYSISYDYGSDHIFPDFDQHERKPKDCPHISFDFVSRKTDPEKDLNASVNETEMVLKLIAYHTDRGLLEDLIDAIRKKLLESKFSHYYPYYLSPYMDGSVLIAPWGNGKVFQLDMDIIAKYIYEY